MSMCVCAYLSGASGHLGGSLQSVCLLCSSPLIKKRGSIEGSEGHVEGFIHYEYNANECALQ